MSQHANPSPDDAHIIEIVRRRIKVLDDGIAHLQHQKMVLVDALDFLMDHPGNAGPSDPTQLSIF